MQGCPEKPPKPARVARYLQSAGYRISPINPFADEILGEKVYNRVIYVPELIEIIDVFRYYEELAHIVEEAFLKKKLGTPDVIGRSWESLTKRRPTGLGKLASQS